jgi:hypothetical protein
MKKGDPQTQGKSKGSGPEWGGKGGFSGASGVDIFTCPECGLDHALPDIKPGETPQCPKCAIPLKAKYTK